MLHRTVFGFHDVQAHSGAEGEEVVKAVVAPDGREAKIIGRTVWSGDEIVVEVSVVGLDDEDAAGAAEHGHVAVAGVAVQVGAALRGVQHVAVQFTDFRADGQPVVVGVLRKVRVLDGDGEEVVFQRHGGTVVGAGVENRGGV